MLVRVGNPVRPCAVTELILPDDFSTEDQFLNAVGALSIHLPEGASPEWVDTDDEELRHLLEDHYAKEVTHAHA